MFKWLAKKVALPIIRRAVKSNDYFTGYYLSEVGGPDKASGEVLDLLSVLTLQEQHIYPTLDVVNRVVRFKIISPLKLDNKEEWGEVQNNLMEIKQSRRLPSVLYYPDKDLVVDIKALSWRSFVVYDIAKEAVVSTEISNDTFTGVVYVYDKQGDTFIPFTYGLIHDLETFMGQNQCTCGCLKIIDSSKPNQFVCNVALKSMIPTDFYRDYVFVDARLSTGDCRDYDEGIALCNKLKDKIMNIL